MAGKRKFRKPLWERLPGENEKQWKLFVTYRDDEGLERSIAKVADSFGLTYTHTKKLAIKKDWRARAEAWDTDLDKRRLWRQRWAAQKAEKRQMLLGENLQKIAGAELMKLAKQVQESDDAVLNAKEIATLLKLGVEVERLNIDAPTSITKETGSLKVTWEEKPDKDKDKDKDENDGDTI